MQNCEINEELAEEICSECNGSGRSSSFDRWYYICNKCKGTGKLDWIDKVMGKRPNKISNKIINGDFEISR